MAESRLSRTWYVTELAQRVNRYFDPPIAVRVDFGPANYQQVSPLKAREILIIEEAWHWWYAYLSPRWAQRVVDKWASDVMGSAH